MCSRPRSMPAPRRAITQVFFDNDLYFRYLDRVRARGIDIPDRARHHADAQFQAGEKLRHPRRHHGAGSGSRKNSTVSTTIPRPASWWPPPSPPARCRSSQARRRYLPFLHHEPRRSRVRDQPSARHPPAGRTESRLTDVRVRFSRSEPRCSRPPAKRILVLDGAMGTMIQGCNMTRRRFAARGSRISIATSRGNNDLLILTQPKAIEDIHADYLRAGADIVATNTFSSTSIAQADYEMSDSPTNSTSKARSSRAPLRFASPPRTASRASSPAPSARPTAPPRFRPTSPIPASAPSPSTICARPMANRSTACSTAAPICCWSRPSSTRSTPRRRSTRSPRSPKRAASTCR